MAERQGLLLEPGAGVMQLTPKVQHSTGSIFWNSMHPGGLGGMATWGR